MWWRRKKGSPFTIVWLALNATFLVIVLVIAQTFPSSLSEYELYHVRRTIVAKRSDWWGCNVHWTVQPTYSPVIAAGTVAIVTTVATPTLYPEYFSPSWSNLRFRWYLIHYRMFVSQYVKPMSLKSNQSVDVCQM